MSTTPLLGAVEAGGTKIVCALGTGPHDLQHRVAFPTADPSSTLERIVAYFDGHRQEGRAISALGAVWFGPLDLAPTSATFGSVTNTPKPRWSGTDVIGQLRRRLEVPVVLDTDVNGAAWGERRWGATRGLRSSAYVTVGTGIGGGAIVEGHRVHGLLHPEMGHLHVQRHPDDPFAGVCPYHHDCIEGMASGPAIKARAGKPAQDLGPADRVHAVHIEAWYLAQLVTAMMYLLSPQRIVLGGGVMHMEGLLEAVREATERRVAGYIDPGALADGMQSYLVRPGLGDDAGVLGAVALAEEALTEQTLTEQTLTEQTLTEQTPTDADPVRSADPADLPTRPWRPAP